MIQPYSDDYFMKEALKEAHKAFETGEVPVGAVVVIKNKIIARAHNQTEKLTDATAHAEMLACTAAANYLGSKYLNECTLYVTLEPCAMCAGAMVHARVKRLVYGTSDPKAGAAGSIFNIIQHPSLNHRLECSSDVLADECRALLRGFFVARR
jgi:tRNA(adenine34) deaminase